MKTKLPRKGPESIVLHARKWKMRPANTKRNWTRAQRNERAIREGQE